VLGELVRCARNCGRHDVARRALAETLDMAGSGEDRVAADAHRQLADLAVLDEDFAGARRHFEAAAAAAETTGPRLDAARRWFALASFLADQTRPGEALRVMVRAREVAGTRCDPAFDSECLGFEGLLHAMLGQPEAAREHVNRALEIAIEHNLTREAAMAYRRVANIREYGSDYAGEREAHLHAVALCRSQNEAESEHSCLTCLSYVFFRTGEWKRALDTTRALMKQPDAHPAMKAGAVGVQSMIAAFRGQHRRAFAKLEESRIALRRFGVLSFEFHLLWAQAISFESAGARDEAAKVYRRMLDLWDDTEDRHDILPGAVSAAAFFSDAVNAQQLARVTDVLHTIARDNDNDESRAARLAVLAETAAANGDWATAVTHMTGARVGYDRLGVAVERALVRRRLARMLIVAGRELEAATEREACAVIARQLGMRTTLASIDVGPGSPAPRRDAALTGRQHDVLRLLAAGLTNKEAAERLGLSPRTVEMHVASLLDRLNCRTRAEAIRRAGERGLLEEAGDSRDRRGHQSPQTSSFP
jgi:DNA-binding CsgD family transcriptional regulator/tetratricopeptide (TPR) repeat protein